MRDSLAAVTPAIAELAIRARPTFSFEFFPPSDAAGLDQLVETVALLEPLKPDFVSVTYGASGSSRHRTIDATKALAERTEIPIIGHLTCTGQTVAQLHSALDDYAAVGVRTILAVRGDAPGGPSQPWHPIAGGLANATELVALIAERGDFEVGVAAFPDGHPAGGFELDARLLADKQAAGATFAITQLFFNVERYVELLGRAEASGATMPIIAGLMPITRYQQMARFAELSGAPVPPAIVERLAVLNGDETAVQQVGAQIGLELAETLLSAGAPGLHFFTQNRSGVTREILATLLASRSPR